MQYDLVISIIFYVCGYFYIIAGAYAIINNVKSKLNRLFIFFAISLAIWSFTYSIANTAPTAEESAFWMCMSIFGWGVFYAVLLHLILVLTKTEIRMNKRIALIAIYLPALINIILFAPFGILGKQQYEMEKTELGWVNVRPADIWGILFIVYFVVVLSLVFLFLIRWYRKLEPGTPLKKQAGFFLISLPITFVLGAATDNLPGIIGTRPLPRMAIIFMVIPIITLFFASKKRGGVFLERKERKTVIISAEESDDGDRLRLFQFATSIFVVGAGISFLIGYFGMGKDLLKEFILAGSLSVLGIITRLIPVMSKKPAVQNTIFLMVSVLGTFFFLATNAKTGALTVWSVYIIFLLFTVILDSKIHALVFTVSSIIIQIVFWIIRPKIPVIINVNEYTTRIFVIMLSFIVVRYLTEEYDAKIKAYGRFAGEQEILEKISSSFISVNSENAKRKIDEMVKTASGLLKFDNAYLLQFDADYEGATVVNTYVKDFDNSLPFRPEMEIKTADLPVARLLIDRNAPIMSEDVTEIAADEGKNYTDFFTSRGINSFFALPVRVDKTVGGMFVIEYSDRSDKRFTEGRLHFLKIIANILGDARKKILYEERLYNFAYFDEATKLANRNMLKKRLDEVIYRKKESGKIAVLDVELENLRMINDTFGHAAGEQVMIESAVILKKLLEKCCEVSRTGEGEFAVILPNVLSSEQIERSAHRILDSFSRPVSTKLGIEALHIIVRIGISVYPDDGRDADSLLKNADLAGYEAKSRDKDYVFYTDRLENEIAETTQLTNKLFRSLEKKEYSLEFQPQISCETEKTVGFEALLRWTTDDNRRIPPNRFIPMLEQTGLIYDVGLWVLEEALKEQKKLVEKGFPPLRVSVNLSVVQFEEDSFISDIAEIIKKSGVNPEYIELEITESLFSKEPKLVLEKLYKLKELGIKIAIDDFGSGYSSLNRLKMLPFDRIKIDKSIIDYIDLDDKSAPITKTIILLANEFKAEITAEGVETKEQAEFLKSIFCGEIQGFYYSRPLTSEAFEEFLRAEADTL